MQAENKLSACRRKLPAAPGAGTRSADRHTQALLRPPETALRGLSHGIMTQPDYFYLISAAPVP